jgi:hypothetical protein
MDERMSENPEVVLIRADMRGPSAEADCLDCLVAFPVAIQRMRSMADESHITEAMIAKTCEAFARLDSARGDLRLIAAAASDHLYRQVVQLTVMDRYTRAYVGKAIRSFFDQLKTRAILTYYILDNSLRDDRLQAVIELFELAGVSVVTPRLHGADWDTLSNRIRSCLASGSHVAYIEPDAAVNHIALAQHLAGEFACVATFRNLAPENPRLSVITFRGASH